jgi:hypothetical protein
LTLKPMGTLLENVEKLKSDRNGKGSGRVLIGDRVTMEIFVYT